MSAAPAHALLAMPSGIPAWLEWFYHLGRFFIDRVVYRVTDYVTPDLVTRLLVFFLILAVAYYAGRGLERLLRKNFLRPPRLDEAMGRLIGHLTVFAVFLLGFSIAITIFGTSIAELATGLGLLTLALGFGMQNTVANLMGGVSLAFDKPFRPGDRIQVGEYWGTVQTIGLRSTTILTPRKEVVIVPNKIMEEREIWNYTMFSSEYRLDLDIKVGLSADWHKAEEILQKVADEHPNTLRFRPAQVLFRGFDEAGIQLQLRAWLADVTARAETQSDLLKATRDRFAIAGIELPYPHRTVIMHKDGAPVTPTTELKPYSRTMRADYRVLVALADPHATIERAEFCTKLAKALPAGLITLYVQDPGHDWEDADITLRMIGDHARDQRVWYKPLIRTGEVVETVAAVAREERVDMILIGVGRGRIQQLWRRDPEIGERLRLELQIPIHTLHPELGLSPHLVEDLRGQIREHRDRRAKTTEEAKPPPPKPSTDPEPEPVPPT